MNKKNVLFSIVIPVFNEEKMILGCLESIYQQEVGFEYEIIVVDNKSTDTTVQLLKDKGVTLIEEEKRGVGAARKKGTEGASGMFIVHIDADTHLPPNYLQNALTHFEKDSNLVCLGGQFYYYDASAWKNFLRVFVHWSLWFFARVVSFGRVGPMGNNMIFKKEIYDKTGGFDNELKYGEDMDLCRKLSKFGRVYLDMRLTCTISVRRFTLDKRLWIYFLNFVKMCIFGKAYQNELPHSDEIGKS